MDERVRDILVVVLACGAGCMDAFAILALGGVFIFALTGNTIFMAISIVDGNYVKLLTTLIVFAAFIPGTLLGTKMLKSSEPGQCWNSQMTKAMSLEAGLIFIFFVLLYLRGDNTEFASLVLPIAVSSFAMGLQFSITSRLAVKGAMVIMITGMLIKLFNEMVFPDIKEKVEVPEKKVITGTKRPLSENTSRFFGLVWISFFVGALLSALLIRVNLLLPVIFILATEILILLFVTVGMKKMESTR